MAIDEKAVDPNDRNVAVMQNNLADLYRDQGRYADAELLFKRDRWQQRKKLVVLITPMWQPY